MKVHVHCSKQQLFLLLEVEFAQEIKQKGQAPLIQKEENTIFWINLTPVDNAIRIFPEPYSVTSDLSGG